jgi:PIN domain nuclease of toxin-antitoxin system
MKLLLDTHIWLDCALKPERLGRRLRRELAAVRSELWVSPISAWEVLKLVDKRRFRTRGRPEDWLESVHRALPINEAPITFEIARETASFSLPHRDPADAWLVATARVYDLVLATRDDKIIQSGVVETLADN